MLSVLNSGLKILKKKNQIIFRKSNYILNNKKQRSNNQTLSILTRLLQSRHENSAWARHTFFASFTKIPCFWILFAEKAALSFVGHIWVSQGHVRRSSGEFLPSLTYLRGNFWNRTYALGGLRLNLLPNCANKRVLISLYLGYLPYVQFGNWCLQCSSANKHHYRPSLLFRATLYRAAQLVYSVDSTFSMIVKCYYFWFLVVICCCIDCIVMMHAWCQNNILAFLRNIRHICDVLG